MAWSQVNALPRFGLGRGRCFWVRLLGVGKGIAQEQVGFVASNAHEVQGPSTQINTLGERLASIPCPPAEESRRSRDKQLIKKAGIEQLTNQGGSALGEDEL